MCEPPHSAYLKHLKANNIDTGLLMQQIEDVIIKVNPEGGHWDKMSDSEVIENNCVHRLPAFNFSRRGKGGRGRGGLIKLKQAFAIVTISTISSQWI
jgi:hypothetical protein